MVREQLITAQFDKDRKLVSSSLLRIGAIARLGRNHNTNRSTRWSSWQALSTGPIEVDSVHSTEETFTLDLPMELSIGAEWELNSKSGARWRAGVEWRQSRWSSVPLYTKVSGKIGLQKNDALELAL